MKQIARFIVLICLLAGCGQVPVAPTPQPTATEMSVPPAALTAVPTADEWWNDAIFYEVFVRSFYDSDGDGIGDLTGLIEKLDYLNDGDPATDDDLGVTALWLMPVFDSPSYHGYDVVDYYTVNADYGTDTDFKELIDKAHQRGIRVIVDLVLNHTSSQHPWFVESASGPDSEKRDWYVWTDDKPGYLGPWGQQVWHPKNDSYYYGVFWDGMPDLNLENPEVTAELYDVAHFWLKEMETDGFRLDAIKHYVEDGKQQVHTLESHAWLNDFHTYVRDVGPDAFTVGEAWDSTPLAAMYVDGGVDAVFEFSLAQAILDSVNRGRATPLVSAIRTIQRSYPEGGFATFLTNHDQDRTMNVLGHDPEKAKLAAAVLLTLPGVPFLYYGEEIGMTGVKPDEMIRTPMQWTAESQAGFTGGKPWEPVNRDYEEKNVEAQAVEPDSLLSHYRTLIALRNAHPALHSPTIYPLESDHGAVYAYLRYTDDEVVLVVVNLGEEVVPDYASSLADSPLLPGHYRVTDLLTETEVEPLSVEQGGSIDSYRPLPELRPRSVLILKLDAGEE